MYFLRKILKPEVDVNTYYYYCCCCCRRWWHLLLLGSLVLRPSISSLLQSATAFFITKCDGLLLQSATAFLLQSATSVITKCGRYYKVWQFYYKVRQVLQSATIITKCDSTKFFTVIVSAQLSNLYIFAAICMRERFPYCLRVKHLTDHRHSHD